MTGILYNINSNSSYSSLPCRQMALPHSDNGNSYKVILMYYPWQKNKYSSEIMYMLWKELFKAELIYCNVLFLSPLYEYLLGYINSMNSKWVLGWTTIWGTIHHNKNTIKTCICKFKSLFTSNSYWYVLITSGCSLDHQFLLFRNFLLKIISKTLKTLLLCPLVMTKKKSILS